LLQAMLLLFYEGEMAFYGLVFCKNGHALFVVLVTHGVLCLEAAKFALPLKKDTDQL
jgi:hypothetical protein